MSFLSFLQHSRRAFTPKESAAMLTLCSSLIYAGRCTQAKALEELKKTPEGWALLLQLQSRMGESYKKKIADRLRAEVRKRKGASSKKFLSIQFKTLQLLLHVSFTFWGLFGRTWGPKTRCEERGSPVVSLGLIPVCKDASNCFKKLSWGKYKFERSLI